MLDWRCSLEFFFITIILSAGNISSALELWEEDERRYAVTATDA